MPFHILLVKIKLNPNFFVKYKSIIYNKIIIIGVKMKITVIGAGNVGATAAQVLANKELANDIYLVDILDGIAKGKALDMYESMPILQSDSRIHGTANYEDTVPSPPPLLNFDKIPTVKYGPYEYEHYEEVVKGE